MPSVKVNMLVAACVLSVATAQTQSDVRICVPAAQSKAQLQSCTNILSGANTASVRFTCISGASITNCYRLVAAREADLVSTTGDQAYTATLDYNIIPILGESYAQKDDLTAYYSVAVVPKEFCSGANKTLTDLRGKNSCHTGYQRNAGWDLPVGALLASGSMPIVSLLPEVEDDAESVATFFGDVCAPRSGSSFNPVVNANGTGAQYPELCGACGGACNADDPYYSYEGVVRGLTEGACDVGFTNNTAFINYTADGTQRQPWSTRPASDFRLLCPTGGCASLSDYSQCNMARAPSRAIMASTTLATPANVNRLAAIQSALVAAGSNASFVRSAVNVNGVQMFFLSADTTRLIAFPAGLEGFLTSQTLKALRALNQLPTYRSSNATEGRLSFCTGSAAEQAFCLSAARVLNTSNSGFAWTCSRPANGSADCAADVAAGNTDVVVTGATGIYAAYRNYSLRAIAAEDDGSGEGATYYSVAVVKKAYCDTADAARGFAGLRGKSMCSTGFGRTAGWTMPIGYLADKGLLNTTDLNSTIAADAQAASRFFGPRICAAGNMTSGPVRIPGGNRTTTWPELCQACSAPSECNNLDRYYDYSGSFRGVVEGTCNVSFTKNDAPIDYSQGGTDAKSWAPRADDYRLLCPDGGCRSITEFSECTAAKVPSRSVLVRPNFGKVRQLQRALIQIAETNNPRHFIFNETSNPQGYLFQKNVQTFIPIESTTPTYLGAAGRAIQSVADLSANSNVSSASTSG